MMLLCRDSKAAAANTLLKRLHLPTDQTLHSDSTTHARLVIHDAVVSRRTSKLRFCRQLYGRLASHRLRKSTSLVGSLRRGTRWLDVRGRKLVSHGSLHQQTQQWKRDDAEARNDFWSMEEDFIHRHHVEPRCQLHVPRNFPNPTEIYTGVTKTTHTNLDVFQEKRVDDYWNVDVDQICQTHGQDSRSSPF